MEKKKNHPRHPKTLNRRSPKSVQLITSGISTTTQNVIQIDLGFTFLCMRDFAPLGQSDSATFGGSHTRTVVRECCKGDDESQWERGKFDPPPPKNPLTDGHQNLCR